MCENGSLVVVANVVQVLVLLFALVLLLALLLALVLLLALPVQANLMSGNFLRKLLIQTKRNVCYAQNSCRIAVEQAIFETIWSLSTL